MKIVVCKDGPYLISGGVPLDRQTIIADKDNNPVRWKKGKKFQKKETYALCRCGKSKEKPYCDGSHLKYQFNGTETAKPEKYLKSAEKLVGPDLDLTDDRALCARARFCHRKGGTWNLTEKSDDPKARSTAIREACDCPSGRLVAWEKSPAKRIEPDHKPSISIIEDPPARVSGPIWVKGRIPIKSEEKSFKYETRNRVTLCRCGNSKNKPFCDGCHVSTGFDDGEIESDL